MSTIDFYPLQGMLRPNEPARLAIETAEKLPDSTTAKLTITHLADTIQDIRMALPPQTAEGRYELEWQPQTVVPQGYGLTLRLLDQNDNVLAEASSAIDVLNSWNDYPRYGFLTDFTPGRDDLHETIEALARYHINGLQFYDWQYRHDMLLAPDGDFIDPLGRELSPVVVSNLIDAAHGANMAAMPYLAIYAASLEYAEAHPEQGLYDENGQPLTFHGFLGLMDPTADSAWTRHLLAECDRVLAALPFDGLHVDQYGDPKLAYDASGNSIDLPQAFVDFMAALKDVHPKEAAVFNAVGNWPIEALAAGPQDFMYIEIWPPATAYRDIGEIVSNARGLSGNKPVVIAHYLPALRPVNNLLAEAIIIASGGTRIALGEKERLLSDPYFPKHEAMPHQLGCTMRRYADFAVRYGEWLGPSATDNPVTIVAPDDVWTITRRAGNFHVVNLINLSGLGPEPRWDEDHGQIKQLEDVRLTVELEGPVKAVYWASPESETADLFPLPWRHIGRQLQVPCPRLGIWSMLAIEIDNKVDVAATQGAERTAVENQVQTPRRSYTTVRDTHNE